MRQHVSCFAADVYRGRHRRTPQPPLELRRYCVIRRELCGVRQLRCDILALAIEALLRSGNVAGSEPASVICTLAAECRSSAYGEMLVRAAWKVRAVRRDP